MRLHRKRVHAPPCLPSTRPLAYLPAFPCLPACHAEALDADSKNYHAWAHRQVVVAAAGAWQSEMEYLEGLLQADVRNNSAWNQRAFVIRVRVVLVCGRPCCSAVSWFEPCSRSHWLTQLCLLCCVVIVDAFLMLSCCCCGNKQHTLDSYGSLQELLDQELLYVAEQVQRAPDNESAWNYLWGLFSLPGCPQHEMGRQDKVRVWGAAPGAGDCCVLCARSCGMVAAKADVFASCPCGHGTDCPCCLRVCEYAGFHNLQGGAVGLPVLQARPGHARRVLRVLGGSGGGAGRRDVRGDRGEARLVGAVESSGGRPDARKLLETPGRRAAEARSVMFLRGF
jgi:hypothetical protein